MSQELSHTQFGHSGPMNGEKVKVKRGKQVKEGGNLH